VKDGNNKQPTAIVVLSDKLQPTDVEKVEALSKAQVEEKAPGFAPRLLSSTIDIEVKRGVEKKQPITLCFVVDKKRLPSPAQQQQDKQRPDGGCRKVEVKEACLSYLNGRRFECVDKQLNDTNSNSRGRRGGAETIVCGTSPHLSSFALLLSSSSSSECVEDVFFWIAIGLIGGVLFFFLLVPFVGVEGEVGEEHCAWRGIVCQLSVPC